MAIIPKNDETSSKPEASSPTDGATTPTTATEYKDLFVIEIEGWCHGIAKYSGEISSVLVFSVVKALAPAFRRAISELYVFDIIDVATKISKAAKYLVSEQDITFKILSNFPDPVTVTEDQQYIIAQILEKVEKKHGGAIGILEEKWRNERE